MPNLPLPTLIYGFSCHFLWFSLSLFHYLDEEIAEDKIGKQYWKWHKSFEHLTRWAMDEWQYVWEITRISEEEKKTFSLIGETLGKTLILHIASVLSAKAASMHTKYPDISEPDWLYYHYCSFLHQVLKEFDLIVQGLGKSSAYYNHYQESTKLFHNMIVVMNQERPLLYQNNVIDEDKTQVTWAEIDTSADKLATIWHQAVLKSASNQQLPDFSDDTM